MTKEEIEAIAEAVYAKIVEDLCPCCGAIGIVCAETSGEHTVCRVTRGVIKDASTPWAQWNDGECPVCDGRGEPPERCPRGCGVAEGEG